MGLFRKKSAAADDAQDRMAKAIAAERQAKWDELEAMVAASEHENKAVIDLTNDEDKPLTSHLRAVEAKNTVTFEGHNLQNVDTSEFTADLKADIPTTAEAIDVTPEPEPVFKPVFRPEAEFETQPPVPAAQVEPAPAPTIETAPALTLDAMPAAIGAAPILTASPVPPKPDVKLAPKFDPLLAKPEDTQPRAAMSKPAMPEIAKAETPKPKVSKPEPKAAMMPSDYAAPDAEFQMPPPPIIRSDRADIGSMRLDVARISSDIQSGEELYRRAQKRIENLTSFVEKAEIDFSMLSRLEPENRRLKARNRTLDSEVNAQEQKIDVLRIDLEDHQRRLSEKTRHYEEAQSKLSIAQKSLQEYERALSIARETSDRNALNAERLQTSLDVERRENDVLRTRVTDTVAELDVRQSAYLEAKKVADSLAQDCADYRHQAEIAQKDAGDLRKALSDAQMQNNAMKSEMVALHEDIRTFKTQAEFTIISREDEMSALQQQVDHMKKQLEIKDEIVRNAARDVTELRKIRTAQDLERERLETHIETQAYQLEQASTELLQTKQDVSDFDRRYQDVASALNVAQARRMPTEPMPAPDIQPAPPLSRFVPLDTAQDSDKADDNLDGLSEDDIADRVFDYRLGLRPDIA